MRGAARVVRLDIVEGDAQVLAAPAQHPPHGRGPRAVQGPEGGIGEGHVGVVAGAHPVRVAGLEGSVKLFDQLGVGVHTSKLLE